MDLVALSNGLHGSVQMDSVALFSWIGWLRHHGIFTRRLRDSGIKIISGKKYGIHSLRHTLGTLLLEKETSLPMISQILGHQSIKSTETYLKLNMNELSKCPIDPDRVFDL